MERSDGGVGDDQPLEIEGDDSEASYCMAVVAQDVPKHRDRVGPAKVTLLFWMNVHTNDDG